MRFTARHDPFNAPSRAIATSAYRLHVGVNRQRIPKVGSSGDSVCW